MLQPNIVLAKCFSTKSQVLAASTKHPVGKMLFEQKSGHRCFNQTSCWQKAF
jgi:hypothetical protein